MEIKVINKKDNALLSRVEVKAEIGFFNEPTPKKEDIKKKIASMEKADEKLVVIRKIACSFGFGKANVLAYIYKSEDELNKAEPKKKEVKKAEGAAPKEEPKEEEPKE